MHLKLKTLLWIMCLIFCYVQVTQASCLSYGHSCWGAHGKRSGAPTEKLIEQIPDENANSRWEIIKILQDKNNFPIRKNYRKSFNVYRLGKIEDTPYDQLFAEDTKSEEQLRPGEAIISDNANIDSTDLLSPNSIFDENLGKSHRVPKFYKAVET